MVWSTGVGLSVFVARGWWGPDSVSVAAPTILAMVLVAVAVAIVGVVAARWGFSLRDIDILVGDFALTRSYRLPEFIVDNPKFRNLGDDPAGFSLNPKKELK